MPPPSSTLSPTAAAASSQSLFKLLSCLWLHEPDAEILARVHDFGELTASLPDAGPSALAPAYADLFLLNVYPYGTAYTDEWGELNTPEAQRMIGLYAQYDYHPPELSEVGAPDHLGLCLGLLDHLPPAAWQGEDDGVRMRYLYELATWAPICCFAAERDPSAHPFYRALAALTREVLVAAVRTSASTFQRPGPMPEPVGAEPRLRDVVRFLLVPARCGMFLSRSRFGALANGLGLRLPFGSRFEVCEWLFTGAGEGERVRALLETLQAESNVWAGAYRTWAEQYPGWRPIAQAWLARVAETQRLMSEMQELARLPHEVEYEIAADERSGRGGKEST